MKAKISMQPDLEWKHIYYVEIIFWCVWRVVIMFFVWYVATISKHVDFFIVSWGAVNEINTFKAI